MSYNIQKNRTIKSYPFLQGGGEMGELTRNLDWSQTPVGTPDRWAQSLRTVVALVLRNPSPMFLYWGRDAQTLFYNEAFRNMQRPPGIFPALGDSGQHLWPEHAPVAGSLIDQVFDNGEAVFISDKLVPVYRNGHFEDAYWSFSYSPVLDESDAVGGVLATCVETSLRYSSQANQLIEIANERARLAIQSAELGVYEVNIIAATVEADARFHEILDTHRSNKWEDLFSSIYPDDRFIRQWAIEKALQTGQLSYQARITRKDSSIHWIRVLGRVLFDEKGKAVKLIGVIQDITEQKRFAEELAIKVAERTKELAQANLQLQQSNAELNQFAYVASHDLQEPLRKVRTYTGMLSSDLANPSPKINEYLQRIESSVKRMQNLIHDVLGFSRVAKPTEKFETLDLSNILKTVLEDYDLLIEQSGAVVTVHDMPVVEANSSQMSQLFSNLISNALKFRSEDRPEISLSSAPLSKEEISRHTELFEHEIYYAIECKDNGIGFDSEYAEKIFVIFQRLHGKQQYEGTGIGLAMCKKIVLNHQGLIYARSALDQGASFTIILPEKQIQPEWHKQDPLL